MAALSLSFSAAAYSKMTFALPLEHLVPLLSKAHDEPSNPN
jgi:hypothetical protein